MSTFPQGSNTYVPSFEASGRLVVDFARKVESFPLNRYIAILPVQYDTGYYLKFSPDESSRSQFGDGRDWFWAPGAAAPDNYIEKSFEFAQYLCKRRAYPFALDSRAVEQAAWDVVANYGATAAALAMTQRARVALGVGQNTALWGTHTDTATALTGGAANSGTPTDPRLKELVQSVGQIVHRATNGVVSLKDLVMVLNPYAASKISQSQEVHAYLKESPFALGVLQGDNQFNTWGIPSTGFYGLGGCVVEDTVITTSNLKATRDDSYAMSNTNILFVSRPNGLTTVDGSFSTLELIASEEMTTEIKYDTDNRRHLGRVVENYDVQLASSLSGYLVTEAIS